MSTPTTLELHEIADYLLKEARKSKRSYGSEAGIGALAGGVAVGGGAAAAKGYGMYGASREALRVRLQAKVSGVPSRRLSTKARTVKQVIKKLGPKALLATGAIGGAGALLGAGGGLTRHKLRKSMKKNAAKKSK
ncbi:hypothetical protein LCGC14_0146760 [marine sediment metagenome]|uniref:Uncharacterized protein n=1 Tax=marine sediment metagenome TaxID=412755 RepID=A0A0F9V3J3_9ZZZZ